MTELTGLTAVALRGTSRLGVPEPGPGPLGEVLRRIERDTPEATLLARAAVTALHAQAGQTPARPNAPVPEFRPTQNGQPQMAHTRPSAEILALLSALSGQPRLMTELLRHLQIHGLMLTARDALPLWQLYEPGGDPLSGTLWPVLNDHARWLARLHPQWRRCDPEQVGEAAAHDRLRRELVEAHAAHPEATAQALQARWPELKADERRIALNAVAASLHPADLPLLELAQSDRLEDVRRLARLLPAHLPGPLADEVRSALQAAIKVDARGRLRLNVKEVPAPLRNPRLKPGETENELGLLVAATKMADLRTTVPPEQWPAWIKHLGYALAADLHRSAYGGASLSELEDLPYGPQEVLEFWPQARVLARFWEATERLLAADTVQVSELTLLHHLLQASNVAPGMLAGSGATRPADSSGAACLSQLAGRLLDWAARAQHVPLYQHTSLLLALAEHLDARQPLPPLPPHPEPAAVPIRESLGRSVTDPQQRQHLEIQYAECVRIIDLRRRIHTLLPSGEQP